MFCSMSIVCRLSGVGSQGQLSRQRNPDIPGSAHLLNPIRWDPWHSQLDIFPSACPRWHEPPQLTPPNAE